MRHCVFPFHAALWIFLDLLPTLRDLTVASVHVHNPINYTTMASTNNKNNNNTNHNQVSPLPGLANKFAVVTGSTSGIGLAIAHQLAASGCHVVVNGRSMESCQNAMEKLPKHITNKSLIVPVPGNVSTAEGVQEFVEAIEAARTQRNLPPVSILVNNVGVFEVKDFVDVTDDEWLNYHNVNLMSGIRLSRHYLPKMMQLNQGRILFVSSEAGLRTLPHMIPYSVSKAARIAAARGLAETTKGTGVTVNSILPGPTWTAGVESYMQGFAAQKKLSMEDAVASYFQEYEPTSLLQRFLTPEEVAAATGFLCSDLASGINGASQRVEGGIIKHI